MNDSQNPQNNQPFDPNQPQQPYQDQPQQPYPQQNQYQQPPQQPYPPQYQQPYPPRKKKGKGCLIAVIVVVIVFVLFVAFGMTGSNSTTTTNASTNTTGNSTAVESTALVGEGQLGDYNVKIIGAEYETDYTGNDCVVVTYEWTNNSDEGTSFFVAVNAKVFQNGIQSDFAVVSGLDTKDTTEIKPGTTLTVKKAYVLQDKTSPIEIEVGELFSFNDEVVTATFEQPLS